MNFINHIKDRFTRIPNDLINESGLSWKAKGIYMYLASKTNPWVFSIKEIQSNAKDGREALQNGLKELERAKYLKRTRKQDELGFYSYTWDLFPEPYSGKTIKDLKQLLNFPKVER